MKLILSNSVSLADAQPQLAVFKHMLATPISTLACLSQNDVMLENTSLYEQQKIAKRCYKRILSIFSQIGSADAKERKYIKITQFLENLTYYFPPNSVNLKVVYQDTAVKKCKIFTNQLLIEEALVCLINNAIEAHDLPQRSIPFVTLSVFKKQQKLVMSIRDFGAGMTWRHWLLQQFTPFSSKHQGSGLGLAFAKHVFDNLGGEVELHRGKNYGFEVICVLPLSQ